MKAMKKLIAILACTLMAASSLAMVLMPISHNGNEEVDGALILPIKINIVYDGVSQEVTGDFSSNVKISTASKPGYTFLYWNCNGTPISAGNHTIVELASITNSETINLISVWSANSYGVSFYDGPNLVSSRSCTYDSYIGALPTVSKPGYTFLGWSPSGSSRDIINSYTVYKTAGNSSYYAVWNELSYNVSLISDGNCVGTIRCTYDKAYGALTTLTKEGYTFKGWATDIYGNNMISPNTKYLTTGDSVLYAIWGTSTYTTSFYDGTNLVSSRSCTYDSKIGPLPTVSKAGYTFLGWSPSGSSSDIINNDTVYKTAGNRSYYAVWRESSYCVSLIDDDECISTMTCTYNGIYGTLPILSREGFAFKGWATDSDGDNMISSDTEYTITSDSFLYAVWENMQFNASFVDDGAEIESKILRFLGPVGDMPVLAEKGRTFLGWSTDGTKNGIIGPDRVFTDYKNITLYSVWETNTYRISFIDGVTETETMDVAFGNKLGALPSISSEGKEFVGWSLDGTEGNIVTSVDSYDWEDDTVLYAVWNDIEQPAEDLTEPTGTDDTTESEKRSGSLFDNPMTIAALILVITGTLGISYWVYRKGLL